MTETTPAPETTTEALTRVLAEHSIGPDGVEGFHSWRCSHPDRYPNYCTCVPQLVADLQAVMDPDERVARAEAAADSLSHLADVAEQVEARNNELATQLAQVRALLDGPDPLTRTALAAILDGGTEEGAER